MAKKIKRTRQINYWTIGGFEGTKPVEQALVEAKKMGYEGLELTFGAGVFTQKTKEVVVRGWKKEAAKLGMKLESVASGYYWGTSLASTRESERKKAINYTKDYIRAASWLGAKVVLVVPGAVDVAWDPSRPVVPALDVWKNATKSIRALIPTAKTYRVSIGLENVWNKFLTGPFEMKQFIDQFKSPYIGCYFDVANCLINGYPEHWIEILGRRIKGVHFKNFNREDCGGVLHGFGDNLVKGDVNFKEVVKALNKIGYKGPITAEMIPFSRLPDLVLPDMKLASDTAKKLLKVSE